MYSDDDLAGGMMGTAFRDYGGGGGGLRDYRRPRVRSLTPPRGRRFEPREPLNYRRELSPRDPSPPRRRYGDPSPQRRYPPAPRDLTPPRRYRRLSPPGRYEPRLGLDRPGYRGSGYNFRDDSPRRQIRSDYRRFDRLDLAGGDLRSRPRERYVPPIRRPGPNYGGGWF